MSKETAELAVALLAGTILVTACGGAPPSDGAPATPPASSAATPVASTPPPAAGESPAVAPSSAADASGAATGSDRWVMGPRGAGPVRIGMTRDELRAALDGGVEPLGPQEECAYVLPAGAPAGLAVMLVGDRVVRLDLSRRSAGRNVLGIRAGDAEAAARKRLGAQVEVTPHKYVDGHYLTAPTGEGDTWWVVETDGGVVTDVRVGVMPQVRWVEGCS